MKINKLHSWDMTPKEAVALQQELRDRVSQVTPAGFKANLIAASDISYNRFSSHFHAAVVVVSMPEMEIVEISTAEGDVSFPYVPGLLSFREMPVIQLAYESLESTPDVVLMDGHGLSHPRRMGVACHAGLFLDIPTIGCAKSLLAGEYVEPQKIRGSYTDIVIDGEITGNALRTRDGVKPIYVSVGHKIDLETARNLVLSLSCGLRIPMPLREAHNKANELRRLFNLKKVN